MLQEFLISELRDSLMCCLSAPTEYFGNTNSSQDDLVLWYLLISELRDSLMCSLSAPAGYLLLAERLHYKGCVLFLACPRLYNDCYFRIGKMKILTPPLNQWLQFHSLDLNQSSIVTQCAMILSLH